MQTIEFSKLQASGNDFILVDNRKLKIKSSRLVALAKKYCQRRLSVGADGLLVIESSAKADFKMRIFNADGSEAEMCGNGARCVALWAKMKALKFETKAGIIEAELKGNEAKIKLTDPIGFKLDMGLSVLKKKLKVNFLNTGVPHAVIFSHGLDKIDIVKIAPEIRYHKRFQPAGTNVNFLEVLGDDFIKIRTYERGVEAETLACGTGMAASAIIAAFKLEPKMQKISKDYKIKVLNKSGEVINIYFKRKADKVSDVWLQGRAQLIYKGGLYA